MLRVHQISLILLKFMTTIPKYNYFHCYATANDTRYYNIDIQNLLRIKNTYSGVNKVILYIAISEVNKTNRLDKIFVWAVKKLFVKHPSIELKKIFFKDNTGRDFSSYSSMYNLIQQEASSNGYVFFQNRSGFGPFRKEWLKEMIHQFEKNKLTAICGSTISFRDHPIRSQRIDLPHIQTYAFLTKVFFLEKLGTTFPGENETSRLDIIYNGEIALSQFFLNKGYGITCMEWPDEYITNKSNPINNDDIRGNVTQQHQFYHKAYFDKDENVVIKTVKYLKTIILFLRNCIF